MTELILYFAGIVTTISLFGFFYYKRKFKELSSLYDTLLKISQNVFQEKQERESLKRLAKYTWGGFHFTADPNTKWNAVYELKEIAQSEDGKKSKFEVLSVISENTNEGNFDPEWYKDHFAKRTGGGWIDTVNNPKIEWITTMSKSESRALKLKDLGI